MIGDGAVAGLRAEREIDLARWLDAARARWWFVVAGVVAGVLIGGVCPLAGGSTYTATVLISRAQAFAPNSGTQVLTYLTSVNAIKQIATSPASISAAANQAGVAVGVLSGHVTTSAINETTGQVSPSGKSNLVQLSVQLTREKPAEDAVNALAQIVKASTSTGYVAESTAILRTRLANYDVRIQTLELRIRSLRRELSHSPNLSPLDRLVLVSELDQASATERVDDQRQDLDPAGPAACPGCRADAGDRGRPGRAIDRALDGGTRPASEG